MKSDMKENKKTGIIKKDNKKFILINLNIFLLGIVIFFGVCAWKYFLLKESLENNMNPDAGKLYQVDYLDNAKVLGESFESQVKGEESLNGTGSETGFVSEDFKIRQINISGSLNVDLEMGDENSPLAISAVKNEVFSSREEDEIKSVVSWKTNRLSISEVEYSKNGEDWMKNVKEDGFGVEHSVMLPALDADSVYSLIINGRDRDGDKISSEKFAFYTGAPNISFIDVLEEASGKLFGWAMKE
jgi:hypothetical protein